VPHVFRAPKIRLPEYRPSRGLFICPEVFAPVPKPAVFKIGGAWVWRCDHGTGLMGDEFREDQWRHAWDACLSAARKHAALYHDDSEPVEVIDL
jgi:hypothetical protein